jgi:excisionase family DNA binding protein
MEATNVSRGLDPLLTLEEAGELLGTGSGLPRRLVVEGLVRFELEGSEVRIRESALIEYVTLAEIGRESATHPATGSAEEAA